jgi:hypothetical protein
MVIWYIFSRFGMLKEQKSGNPAAETDSIKNDDQVSKKQYNKHVNLQL